MSESDSLYLNELDLINLITVTIVVTLSYSYYAL